METILSLIVTAGISFLIGRWKGIKDFEKEMVKADLLPPNTKEDG